MKKGALIPVLDEKLYTTFIRSCPKVLFMNNHPMESPISISGCSMQYTNCAISIIKTISQIQSGMIHGLAGIPNIRLNESINFTSLVVPPPPPIYKFALIHLCISLRIHPFHTQTRSCICISCNAIHPGCTFSLILRKIFFFSCRLITKI